MHLACPACAATYQVPDAMIGEGRQMRCVRCGESWFAGPRVANAVPDAVPAVAPELTVTPAPIEPVVSIPLLAATPPLTPRSSPGFLTLAWVGSLFVWAAGIYTIWTQRDLLTTVWPPIERLYAWLGPA